MRRARGFPLTSNVVRGMGSVLDLFQPRRTGRAVPRASAFQASDVVALRSDWLAVGRDFHSVISSQRQRPAGAHVRS